MNNGTRKGGSPQAFRVLHESPALEDLWQLHWSHNTGLDNAPAIFMANVDDSATVGACWRRRPVGVKAGEEEAPAAAPRRIRRRI